MGKQKEGEWDFQKYYDEMVHIRKLLQYIVGFLESIDGDQRRVTIEHDRRKDILIKRKDKEPFDDGGSEVGCDTYIYDGPPLIVRFVEPKEKNK